MTQGGIGADGLRQAGRAMMLGALLCACSDSPPPPETAAPSAPETRAVEPASPSDTDANGATLPAAVDTLPPTPAPPGDEATAAADVASGGAGEVPRVPASDAPPEAAAWRPVPIEVAADQVDQALLRAARAVEEGRLAEGDESALGLYLAVLGVDPGQPEAVVAVEQVLDQIQQRALAAMQQGRTDAAAADVNIVRSLRPQSARLAELDAALSQARAIDALLADARRFAAAGAILEPEGDNAVQRLREVLRRQPGRMEAEAALARIEADLVARATAAAEAGDYALSDRLLADASGIRPGSGDVQNASTRIVELREDRASELLRLGHAAVDAGSLGEADRLVSELERVAPHGSGIDELRVRIENGRLYGGFAPGQAFSDALQGGGQGPELVVIPAGEFRMGSPRDEPERRKNEGPRHRIAFPRGFALSRSEITVAQYRAFVEATGYRSQAVQAGRSTVYDERSGSLTDRPGTTWEHDHGGRRADGNLPVVHVAWVDALAYADWLSRTTARTYRLPSEAEFEYALRAGSASRYPWGDEAPLRVIGNLTGEHDRSETRRSWSNAFPDYGDGFWGPAPVRSFEPNGFGLHDMAGNVSEWVEDCWHDNYQRAPADGSAWVNRGCTHRVVRGGSWASAPDQTRSAFRLSAKPTTTSARVGFRVAREL